MNKILFVSATPLDNKDDFINIFGSNDNKYELSWNNAIQNKYICDYNFYYPNNNKIIQHIYNLQIDTSLIEKTILINKSFFLLESIKLTNVKKCIVYLKSINESSQFVKILNTMNIYTELKIKIYEINYEISKKKRLEYINKFQNDNENINIICNVHILDEGIDIPLCDSIYLTHPNNNIVNIIQRISRANRLDKNNHNKVAKIFIWSKDEIKKNDIIKNISKTINIKYGSENNNFINKEIENIIHIDTTDKSNINNSSKEYLINKISFFDYYTNLNKNKENFDIFIKDFKHIIVENYIDKLNDFLIDSEILRKWLEIKIRQDFNDTIKRTYIKDTDYIIQVIKKTPGRGGNNFQSFTLTFYTSKKICFASKSKKKNLLQQYFVDLEETVYKYKNYIIEELNK